MKFDITYRLSPTHRQADFELWEHEDGWRLMLKGDVVGRFGIHATIKSIEEAAHQALCENQNGVKYGK